MNFQFEMFWRTVKQQECGGWNFSLAFCSTCYVLCTKAKYIFHFYYDSSTSPTLFSSKELANSCKICYSMITNRFSIIVPPQNFTMFCSRKKEIYILEKRRKNCLLSKKGSNLFWFDSWMQFIVDNDVVEWSTKL